MIANIRPEILSHLKKDKIMAKLIANCTLTMHKTPINVFDDLLRSIVSQQLSTSAAATIYGRFIDSLDPSQSVPAQILAKTPDELRAIGLSFQKANYLQNVVRHFDEYHLYDTDWDTFTDEKIIEELSKIKGVGKWTVEMILMFSLHREDVLPLDDLIIRNNIILLYDITADKKAQIAEIHKIADKWRPFRSYACRYMWAAKDTKILHKTI